MLQRVEVHTSRVRQRERGVKRLAYLETLTSTVTVKAFNEPSRGVR